MQLSEHFTKEEFEFSQTATRNGWVNVMNAGQTVNAKRLCAKTLEVIRAHYGKPIDISSGYRGPKLNSFIGSRKDSQHSLGEAADFTVRGVQVERVFHDITHDLIPGLLYDQVIYEGGWVHISYREGRLRKSKLIAHFRQGAPTTYMEA